MQKVCHSPRDREVAQNIISTSFSRPWLVTVSDMGGGVEAKDEKSDMKGG